MFFPLIKNYVFLLHKVQNTIKVTKIMNAKIKITEQSFNSKKKINHLCELKNFIESLLT